MLNPELENLVGEGLSVLQANEPFSPIREPLPPIFEISPKIISPPQPMQLAAPFLSVSLLSPSMVQARWNAIEGATNYRLRRDGFVLDVGNVTGFPVGSLPPGLNKFDVAASNASGTSDFSNQVSITTGETQSPVNTPPILPTDKVLRLKRHGVKNSGVVGATAPADEDDTIFGFPSTYVYFGGAAAVAAFLYFGSKK
ncbi:MAG: fibronectin type III domain-containing protein [Pyrinomonadaceae bacterium]